MREDIKSLILGIAIIAGFGGIAVMVGHAHPAVASVDSAGQMCLQQGK